MPTEAEIGKLSGKLLPACGEQARVLKKTHAK